MPRRKQDKPQHFEDDMKMEQLTGSSSICSANKEAMTSGGIIGSDSTEMNDLSMGSADYVKGILSLTVVHKDN